MLEKRKILVVEDNEINRMMLCHILASDYQVLEAENGEEALAVLKNCGKDISLILLDIVMPVMDGYTFLTHVKADPVNSSIPVIVTTQSEGEADEIAALSHGAADFVAKPYKPQIILHRVASIINLRETAAMINLIQYDRLTGLFSKEFFYQRVKDILLQNPDKKYDIICSDIENFKLVNDIFGISAGDQLLCKVAALYEKHLKNRGICGRFEADRFACFLERKWEYTDEMFIEVSEELNAQSVVKSIVTKWGIYHVEDRSLTVEQMCDRALLAANSIKGQYGKYFAAYDDELRNKLLWEQAVTDSMEAALAEGQFEIYLQPKYNIKDNRLAGAEALIRWNHPQWGLQSPVRFIPLFERNGFITKLDQFVWRQACAVLREWEDTGYFRHAGGSSAGGSVVGPEAANTSGDGTVSVPLSISVNVSRADIYNADIVDILLDIVREYQLPPSRLHLEITESAYTENPKQIIDTVKHLRELGFVVEMDDFGTGYSSLNMINEMPIDILKLDMKFIQNETAKPVNQGILRFIMSLARWMNLSVVAEGVETQEQLERLKEVGCDCVQGYYFAKPMPVSEFEELVREYGACAYQAERKKELDGGPRSAAGTLQAFLEAWFVKRNLAETIEYLAQDVDFMGTGLDEQASGKQAMTEYLRRDMQEIEEPFAIELSVIHEHAVVEQVKNISVELILKNSLYTWPLRGGFTMVRQDEDWIIKSFHVSEPGSSQREEEHYPGTLVMENIVRQRQELLNDSLPGGMMGGYLEEGFPFYFINRRMLDYLGYRTQEEFVEDIGGMVSNCMHPDDRQFVDREVDSQLGSGGEYIVEYRMRKKDGSYIWVRDLGRKTTAEDGRPAIASVCMDITEEKLLQEQMKELYEKELAYFAELSSEEGCIQGSVNLTRNRVETYQASTEVAVAHVGDSYEKIIDMLAASAVDPGYGSDIRRMLNRDNVLADYAAGKTDYHLEFIRRRNGKGNFWESTNLRTSREPETGDIIVFFYTLDITERKMQERLLDQMARLDYDVIMDIDTNRGSYRVVAHDHDWTPVIPLQGEFQNEIRAHARRSMDEEARAEYLAKLDFGYMRKRLAEQNAYTFILEMQEAQGMRVKRFRVFYISEELGRVCMTRADVTDIVLQEQRQKEEMAAALLAAEQANAAKTDFLSRMSHEIRTPMNAIIGMSAIAAQHIEDGEQVGECISKIEMSSRFLLSLINDILDMNRIESGKMLLKNDDFSVKEFLDGIHSMCGAYAASRGVKYEYVSAPSLDEAYIGDAMKLQQVLVNIVKNAVKFTGQGGTVTVSAKELKRKRNAAVLRFTVADTGVGMSEAFLPHVFEPFSQEHTGITSLYGGTGLGLAIAKSIVDMMDGRITVCSAKGKGTEFTVDVKLGTVGGNAQYRGPAEPASDCKTAAADRKEDFDFTGKRVLVAEDNLINTEVAKMLLEARGFEVDTAENGRSAIELFCSSPKGYYSVILMDIRMPVMDGLTAASGIRGLDRDDAGTIPIIAMTANAFEEDIEKSMAAGMNAHLAKPVEPESLYQTLYDFIFGKEG